MKSIDLKEDLVNKLVKACIDQLGYLKKELVGRSVFAYAIYCSSGCRNMGVAFCTREGSRLRNENVSDINEAEWYGEVNAAEWDHVNEHYELFSDVNNLIDQIYEIFYNGELDDIDLDEFDDDMLWSFISNFFIDVVVNALTSLKESGELDAPLFEKDLLLGIQFGDPDKYSLEMIEKSSQKLNSAEWHQKVLLNCDLIKVSS